MHLVRSYLCSAVDIYGLRNHLPNGNGKNVMGKGGERKRGYEKKPKGYACVDIGGYFFF